MIIITTRYCSLAESTENGLDCLRNSAPEPGTEEGGRVCNKSEDGFKWLENSAQDSGGLGKGWPCRIAKINRYWQIYYQSSGWLSHDNFFHWRKPPGCLTALVSLELSVNTGTICPSVLFTYYFDIVSHWVAPGGLELWNESWLWTCNSPE